MAWLIWIIIYTVIMSAVMIGCGLMFIKSPPKEINSAFGYRTKRSMLDQEHWDFAHQYAGRVWVRCGIANAVTFLILALCFFFLGGRSDKADSLLGLLLTYAQLIPLLLVIPMTEHALKRRFPDQTE